MILKIGTRKSKLALIQTNLVIDQIKKHYPSIICDIVPIITTGDLITDKPLSEIGGKALFLKEIEQYLLNKKIDLAVHSLKDVPGVLPKNLCISAVLEREDPRDVLICHKFNSIEELPKNSKIGSSSVRRKLFIHQQRSDLEVINFRGNVDSRLNKLNNQDVVATILAAAGLIRLGLFDKGHCHIISEKEMLPAVGQGVLAIETLSDSHEINAICKTINHQPTWQLIQAERAFLEYLDADCKTPLAAHASYLGNRIKIEFMMSDFEETRIIFHHEIGEIQEARSIGLRAAEKMQRELFG